MKKGKKKQYGLRVRSRLKLGKDENQCTICHLGCMPLGGDQKKRCDGTFDSLDICKN